MRNLYLPHFEFGAGTPEKQSLSKSGLVATLAIPLINQQSPI